MREIEIKLRVNDLPATRRHLSRLGFQPLGPRVFERNLVFDTPERSLRGSQQLLRLRSTRGRWWLTFKSPPETGSRHKIREEIEIEVLQGEKLPEILSRLGYYPAWEYHKYRREYQQPRGRGKLLLDETPIGNFVELEGPPRWIDRTAAQLGYGQQDFIVASYGGLHAAWRQERGLPPGDMVFDDKSKRQR